MANTHLLYDDPMHLYQIAAATNKNLICLDIGTKSTGICVLYHNAESDSPSASALTKQPDYTPFEQAIINEYRRKARIAAGDPQPLPKCIVEGQLLPIECITSTNTEEIINILNRVSRDHNSHGFVVGYSCSVKDWHDPNNYVHISGMLARLNSRRLYPRLFTLADEYGSTKKAQGKLKASLPYFNTEQLFNQHRVNYQDAKVLREELFDFRKAYIDCYSAVVFGKYVDVVCLPVLTPGDCTHVSDYTPFE